MERLTESEYRAIPKDYRGRYHDYQHILPEYEGARTAFLPGHGTTLYIEGLSMEIVPNNDRKEVEYND